MTLVAGVAASHTTLMNTRWDAVDHRPEAHAYRDALHEARRRLEDADVTTAIVIGSNHFRGMWLDLMPTFTVGVGDVIGAGEHGTPAGPQSTDPAVAGALVTDLLERGFDPAQSATLTVDHGITHAIQYAIPAGCAVVPIVINCFAPPLPSPRRCADLGVAIGDIVRTHADGRRIAIVASGGLSHQLPFPDWRRPVTDDDRFLVDSWMHGRGRWSDFEARRRGIITSAPAQIASAFDLDVLDALRTGTFARFASLSGSQLEAAGGNGANELRTWLVMAAACSWTLADVLAYAPIPEWLTGMGVVYLPIEPKASTP
jgi:2,3-dihydroxyphenylpropionate 1,2-dioxygenase